MARKQKQEIADFTPIEWAAFQANEWYKALRKAGFTVEQSMELISDRNSYPDWMLPDRDDNIIPFIDPDDDEDD